jgi:hypothetical protein
MRPNHRPPYYHHRRRHIIKTVQTALNEARHYSANPPIRIPAHLTKWQTDRIAQIAADTILNDPQLHVTLHRPTTQTRTPKP